jgi:Na+-translocating ferredoxin:NAD+ oxidoreductase RnfG subunit
MKDEINNIIREEFSNDAEIIFSKYELPKNLKFEIERKVKQKFHSNFVYLYIIKFIENKVGYVILDNVFGKSLPITFLVLFDLKGNIISSHIIKYREQYGGAVKNKNWTRQFIGRNSDSSFEVGSNINSISGATIFVNSVTKGIKKLTLLIKEIINVE